MNLLISPDCISCKKCVKACPANIIDLKEDKPVLIKEFCIRCGHCEAICPTGALTNDALNHDSILEMPKNPVLDPENAELFLRSRRSIRCFKPDTVTREETTRLINIGRYAQTGSNSQGVSYLVIETKEKMDKLRDLTMKFFKSQPEAAYQKLHRRFETAEDDILLRGAPMCILALTRPGQEQNARFALTYIELFAPSLKLGTCWAGFLEMFTSHNTDELRAFLDIPEGLAVSGALLYGYPKYQYHRIPDRSKLELEWR